MHTAAQAIAVSQKSCQTSACSSNNATLLFGLSSFLVAHQHTLPTSHQQDISEIKPQP
jgi:hypothetical protein